MKKLIVLLAALALLLTMVVGCNKPEPAPSQPAPSAPAQTGSSAPSNEPIKIGYLNPLTGDTALWGQTGLNGLILAAEQINAAGGILGRTVEIVGLDNRDSTEDTLIAFNRLIDEYKVIAVVGTNTSTHNIAMAPIANQRKIPIIGTGTTNELVTVDENGNLHPYSFRLSFIDSFQGTKMGEYAIKQGMKTAAFITNIADSYSTGCTEYTSKAFEAGGGKVVAQENANAGDTDYRAQLTRIAPKNPDVLFIPENYQHVAYIARQARELGLTCAFYGYDGWDSVELPEMADGALEGARFASRPGFSLPEAEQFGKDYIARFNDTQLEAESLFTADALYWIKQCLEAAGVVDSVALRDQMENTTSFKGLMGEMIIDPKTHNPARELAIFEIQGKDNVLIEIFY